MDFSHTNITLRRSIWSYGKVQRIVAALHRHFYGIPDLRWGAIANISKKHARVCCKYVPHHNFGLYSNLSTALEDVLALVRSGINVSQIDFSVGMEWFKDEVGKDVYPEFFDKTRFNVNDVPKGLKFGAFESGMYRFLFG